MDKAAIEARKTAILALLQPFCTETLNEEYYELCEQVLNKLGRKKTNVIFLTGQLNIWAAAVVHAVGSINFLFDKSQTPHTTVADIHTFFGTKTSTVANKSKEIRDLLKMRQFGNEFVTKNNAASNPFNNMVMVNGFIVSVNALPEDMQALVRETRAKGGDISFSRK
jgi:hypothetical protein